MRKIGNTVALIFLLASPALAALKLNDPAPVFSLRDSQARKFDLGDAVGANSKEHAQGVILSFFASWCIPCRNELPRINALTEQLKGRGVKVVIVDVKDDIETMRALLAELKVDKPIALSDGDGKVAEMYGVRFLPTTVLIGADGSVKYFIYGEIKDEKELMDGVQKLVGK